jgi:hypothetical protein
MSTLQKIEQDPEKIVRAFANAFDEFVLIP